MGPHGPPASPRGPNRVGEPQDLTAEPDGIARIGMRYIDEIRGPDTNEENLSAWREWVDTSLLAPQLQGMAQAGFASAGWEGAAQYETGPNQKLVLRYEPRTGYAVQLDP
ncbi:MAG: TIGR04255 family protein [Acidimicrobiales bacterium]